uniref:Uncharacterized protein n=1 Tax=Lutzomyia longipalpis TaxID=7200 RepID=A0A1B0CIL0_LUTLO
MALNQNDVFASINNFITLKSKDRANYMHHCRRVMSVVLNSLGNSSDLFKKMSNGFEFSGSYRDNLKISLPDEYDINLKMKLPFGEDKVKVSSVHDKPGYVKINVKDLLEDMKTATGMQEAYKELSKLCDTSGYLLQNLWLNWFESKLSKCFGDIQTILRDEYYLYISKSGPAKTIIVSSVRDGSKFSIDFVIGIVFGLTKWMATRRIPNSLKNEDHYWMAIPKPNKTDTPGQNNPTWIASYPAQEHNIIHNSNRLKDSIRFIKKLRDRRQIQNLKSFYIKNVVMLEVDKRSSNYWNSPLADVLKDMLRAIIEHVEKGIIPSYWNNQNNLIGSFSSEQKRDMADKLKNIERIWTTSLDKEKIMRTILTDEEIRQLETNPSYAGIDLNRLSLRDDDVVTSGGSRRDNSQNTAGSSNLARNVAIGVGVGVTASILLISDKSCSAKSAMETKPQISGPCTINTKKFVDEVDSKRNTQSNNESQKKLLTDEPINELEARYNFHKRFQNNEETLRDFIKDLKKLAINCNFADLQDTLRDRLICGMKDKMIRKKLIAEKNLTFQKACDIAMNVEKGKL